jgi:hypothetical protein
MYWNIFIFIENIINLKPQNIKPIDNYFDGNTISVISTTAAVSVNLTSDRSNRNM